MLVAAALVFTAVASPPGPVPWLSAGAVWLTFNHAQVADRLAEAENARSSSEQTVSCHRWLRRYYVAKEACWLVLFVITGAWPAVVGACIFLMYPLWRDWYRGRA